MRSSFPPPFILYGNWLTDALVTSWGKNPGKADQGSRRSLTPKAGSQAGSEARSAPHLLIDSSSSLTVMIQIGVQLKMEM